MATTTLVAGDISTATITLVASTADLVNFGDDCEMIEVWTPDGTALIYFTTDGSVPTVGAKNTYVLSASANSALEVTVPTSGITKVRLISAGTPSYRVTRTA